jgi:molybdenum cofactor sulfurtransferase
MLFVDIGAQPGLYSLLDAASFLTTTPLDYSDATNAPDFTVYKIFRYPDLGAVKYLNLAPSQPRRS